MRRFFRLITIWSALFREYRSFRRFMHGGEDPSAPVRLAERLIALGPTFVKLGQVLSTRPDVLPPAYIAALSRLQENVPPVPFNTVRDIVEETLGRPLQAPFASFSETPVASASLAQVHRATLADGAVVAVKVQRPGLDAMVRRDLDAIGFGLRWLGRIFPRRVQRTNLVGFFAEFRRYTLQELDFVHEGRVIDRFRANFVDRTDIRFPEVYWQHSGSRVLTMRWAEGLRLSEATAALGQDQRDALVTRLVDVMLKMFVSDGLFHADLHPGNIFFHPDATFTLLDFGMYGERTPEQRDRFILYWFSVVQRQTRRAFHHFKAQTRVLPDADEAAFFARFSALAETFYASRLSEMSFTKVYLEMMKAGYAHGFVFPSELMLHAKALTTAETLIFVLAPDARFERLSRPFIAREYAARTASLTLLKRRISQLAPELILLGELPPAEAIDNAWDWDATVAVFTGIGDRFGALLRNALSDAGFWKTLAERDVRAVLETGPLADMTDTLLEEAWAHYYTLEPSLTVQPTMGAVFTTHLAALTLALHKIFLRHGIQADASYRLIHDLGWRIYTRMSEPPLLMASAFTRDTGKRLRLATNLFRSFPFGPPAYGWRDVPSTEETIAFDCTKCPVAEFFKQHGASELCTRTWCQLDFPLAEKWGGRLERTGTIASGHTHCDFRWHAGTAEEAPRPLPAGSEGS